MYGLDSGVASSDSGGGGNYADILKKIMGMMGKGGSGSSSSGGGGGGGMGGGGLDSGRGGPIGPSEGTWGSNNSGAGPSMVGGPQVSYQPPAAAAGAATGVMRPRQNAGGDFWGPVIQRMIQQYLAQQRGGGPDATGLASMRPANDLGV